MRYYTSIDGVDLSVCGHSRTYVRRMLMLYNQDANRRTAYKAYKEFVPDSQKFIQSIKTINLKKIVPKEYHHLFEEKCDNGKMKQKSNALAILGALFSMNPALHKDWWEKINNIMSLKVHNIRDRIIVSRKGWGGRLTPNNNPHGGIVFHVGRLAPYNHNYIKDAAARMVFLQDLVKVFGTHHIKIAKFDLAIDMMVPFDKLKITPLVNQDKIQLFQDSIYINGNEEDPTGILIYNKSVKEASYLGGARLEIKLEKILEELFHAPDYQHGPKSLKGLDDKFYTLDYLHLLLNGDVDYRKVKILADYVIKKIRTSVIIEANSEQLIIAPEVVERAIVNFILSLNDLGEYALINYENYDQIQLQMVNASKILEGFLDLCMNKYKVTPDSFVNDPLLAEKIPSCRELEEVTKIDRRVISLHIIPFLKNYGDRINLAKKKVQKLSDDEKPYAPEDFIKLVDKYEEFENTVNVISYSESEKKQVSPNNLKKYFPDFYPEVKGLSTDQQRTSPLDSVYQEAQQRVLDGENKQGWDIELVESKYLSTLNLNNLREFLSPEDEKELEGISKGEIAYFEILALLTKEKRRMEKLASLVV